MPKGPEKGLIRGVSPRSVEAFEPFCSIFENPARRFDEIRLAGALIRESLGHPHPEERFRVIT